MDMWWALLGGGVQARRRWLTSARRLVAGGGSVALISLLMIPPAAAFAASSPRAFLTREKGANGPLQTLLEARGVATEELPCIAFQKTEGYNILCDILANAGDDSGNLHPWAVITSPAAAAFFAEAWAQARAPRGHEPSIASVGAGSAKVLKAAGLTVDFLPTKADGKTLAAELPAEAEAGSVLFPSSALAADAIANGLAARGIRTRRINTYTTAAAAWTAADLARARDARFVTFGSPSAVRVWTERVGTAAAAVCVGETTAAMARDCGFGRVLAPSRPLGDRATMLEAWAACCAEAVGEDHGPRAVGRAPSPRLSAASSWLTTPSPSGKYGCGVDVALAMLQVERSASAAAIEAGVPSVCERAASGRVRGGPRPGGPRPVL